MVGNSLKYINSNSKNLDSNTLWKYHQKQNNPKNILTPSHFILSPLDKLNILNFQNLNDLGLTTLKDSNAFKKIQYFSKFTPNSLYSLKNDYDFNYNKINSLYNLESNLLESMSYGSARQHNFNSLKSIPNTNTSLLDPNSFNKYNNYNLNISNSLNNNVVNIDYFFNNNYFSKNLTWLPNFSKYISSTSFMSRELDSPQVANLPKFILDTKFKKKTFIDQH